MHCRLVTATAVAASATALAAWALAADWTVRRWDLPVTSLDRSAAMTASVVAAVCWALRAALRQRREQAAAYERREAALIRTVEWALDDPTEPMPQLRVVP